MSEDITKTRGASAAFKDDRGGAVLIPSAVLGVVKNNIDPTRSGKIQVFLNRMGSNDTDNPAYWTTVSYLSPFFGATPNTGSPDQQGDYVNNPNSYGFWATPPDVGTEVVCVFLNGDPNFGYYIGSAPKPGLNHMVPGIGASNNIIPNEGEAESYGGATRLPVSEINNANSSQDNNTLLTNQPRPVHSYQAGIYFKQGLLRDPDRGPISSSSQRESPSRVFGMSTPGRPIYQGGYDDTSIGEAVKDQNIPDKNFKVVGRRGGHSFVMDDGDLNGRDQLVRLRTATGHQILMNDAAQTLFIIHANGQSYIELGKEGTIDMYSTNSVNIRTQGDLNLHADNDVNIHAANNLNLAATNIHMETAGDITQLVTGAFKNQTGGDYTVKSDGGAAIVASGPASLVSSDNAYINGSNINLNTGSSPLSPEAIEPMTITSHPDTLSQGTTGYASVDGALDSITSRAPAHTPWANANKGVSVNTDISAESNLPEESSFELAAVNDSVPSAPPNPTSAAMVAGVPTTGVAASATAASASGTSNVAAARGRTAGALDQAKSAANSASSSVKAGAAAASGAAASAKGKTAGFLDKAKAAASSAVSSVKGALSQAKSKLGSIKDKISKAAMVSQMAITAAMGKLSSAVNSVVGVIQANGKKIAAIGALGLTVAQLVKSGHLKPGSDAAIDAAIQNGKSVEDALHPSLFTGKNGVNNIAQFATRTDVQVSAANTLIEDSKAALIGAGVITGNESLADSGGVILSAASAGLGPTLAYVNAVNGNASSPSSSDTLNPLSDNVPNLIAGGIQASRLAENTIGTGSMAENYADATAAFTPLVANEPQKLDPIEILNASGTAISDTQQARNTQKALFKPKESNASQAAAQTKLPEASVFSDVVDMCAPNLTSGQAAIRAAVRDPEKLNAIREKSAGATLTDLATSELNPSETKKVSDEVMKISAGAPIPLKIPSTASGTFSTDSFSETATKLLGDPKIPPLDFGGSLTPTGDLADKLTLIAIATTRMDEARNTYMDLKSKLGESSAEVQSALAKWKAATKDYEALLAL